MRQPCLLVDSAVFSGIVEVLELDVGLEVDLTRLARGQLVAVLVEDVDRSDQRTADGARVGQPVLGRDQGEAVPFRGRVVLVDDRPPPVDHLLLDLDRAQGRGVHHPLQTRHVVRLHRTPPRAFQHPGEHHRHELTVGDAVLDVEGSLGVETLKDDDQDARGLHARGPHVRRGVINGAGLR